MLLYFACRQFLPERASLEPVPNAPTAVAPICAKASDRENQKSNRIETARFFTASPSCFSRTDYSINNNKLYKVNKLSGFGARVRITSCSLVVPYKFRKNGQ